MIADEEGYNITSLTLCVGRNDLHRYEERIAQCRRGLLQMEALEERPSRVIQVSFQLVPLSVDVELDDE